MKWNMFGKVLHEHPCAAAATAAAPNRFVADFIY